MTRYSLQERLRSQQKKNLPIVQDLLDTLMAHKDSCVGMATNMIGVKKRIIMIFSTRVDEFLYIR